MCSTDENGEEVHVSIIISVINAVDISINIPVSYENLKRFFQRKGKPY